MSIVKKLLIGAGALVVLLVGGVVVYVNLIRDDAPPELDFLATTDSSTTAGGAPSTTTGTTAATSGVDGTWNIQTGTQVGYRVKEDFIGGLQNADAVGRTSKVTGALTIQGTDATAAQFVADLTSVQSDESRRDSQFQGRIMQTSQFPNATFELTSPISFGTIPTSSSQVVKATATGDLTLRGVTKSATFEIEAIFDGTTIQVKGQIPVRFSDYNIPSPSNAIVSVRDNGVMEFLLVLAR